MNFGSREVGCWGRYWSVKGKFVSSQCESHHVYLFITGTNVSEDTDICDLGALRKFLPVDEKISVGSLNFPIHWKRRPI